MRKAKPKDPLTMRKAKPKDPFEPTIQDAINSINDALDIVISIGELYATETHLRNARTILYAIQTDRRSHDDSASESVS
jgi:hypothetical protein